jgi:hypothetical protein
MLSNKSFSQSEGGMQQYYYMGEKQNFTMVPMVYFQNNNNWYFEGRYNYEALNTVSAYAGKIYEKKSTFSYSLNPVAGLVAGEFNGGSAGLNVNADYKNFNFSSQAQYSFSVENKNQNFTYSWSEFAYDATQNIGAGVCLQQTGEYNLQNKFDKGIFLRLSSNGWTFPIYMFKNSLNEKYFVLSLIYEWTQKFSFRNKNNVTNLTNKM